MKPPKNPRIRFSDSTTINRLQTPASGCHQSIRQARIDVSSSLAFAPRAQVTYDTARNRRRNRAAHENVVKRWIQDIYGFNNVDNSPSTIRPIKVGLPIIPRPTTVSGSILTLFLIHHLPKRDFRDISTRDTHLPTALNLQQLKEIPASSTRRNRHLERSTFRKSLDIHRRQPVESPLLKLIEHAMSACHGA